METNNLINFELECTLLDTFAGLSSLFGSIGSLYRSDYALFTVAFFRTNHVSTVLFRLVHERFCPLNKRFHIFLRLVLRQTDAHRYIDPLTQDRGKSLFP